MMPTQEAQGVSDRIDPAWHDSRRLGIWLAGRSQLLCILKLERRETAT